MVFYKISLAHLCWDEVRPLEVVWGLRFQELFSVAEPLTYVKLRLCSHTKVTLHLFLVKPMEKKNKLTAGSSDSLPRKITDLIQHRPRFCIETVLDFFEFNRTFDKKITGTF